MNKQKSKCFLCLLCAIAHGMAQDDDPRQTRYDKIMEDSSSVDLTMRMDRLEYLPGEGATVSIIVKNNTNEVLEILRPFSDLNYFTPYKINASGKRIDLMPEPYVSARPSDPSGTVVLSVPNLDIKTVTLFPGQEIRASVESFTSGPVGGLDHVQQEPGDYEIEYHYGRSGKSSTTRYRVVEAKLGASSLAVKMPRNGSMIPFGEKEGKKVTLFTYRQAFELEAGGVTYLCVSPVDDRSLTEVTKMREVTVGPGSRLGPFLRVAESTSAFKELTFAVANNEDLTLTWKDAQGRLQVLKLDKNLVRKRAED